MKDYYSILGLDADASPDSIKLAYRRLAREAHPDRARQMSAEAQAAASERMTDLNEAYATLSVKWRRKDYDEEFRKWQAKHPVPAEVAPLPPPLPEPEILQPQRATVRPASHVASNIVTQFSAQVHGRILQDQTAFKWSNVTLEGFTWAMRAGFLTAEYFVALRGFPTLDPAAAAKLVNYASIAVERTRKVLKKSYYLFLIPCQRLREPDLVIAAWRRFAEGSGERMPAGAPAQIALMDITHGRSVPCAPRIEDKRFDTLMQQLGFYR